MLARVRRPRMPSTFPPYCPLLCRASCVFFTSFACTTVGTSLLTFASEASGVRRGREIPTSAIGRQFQPTQLSWLRTFCRLDLHSDRQQIRSLALAITVQNDSCRAPSNNLLSPGLPLIWIHPANGGLGFSDIYAVQESATDRSRPAVCFFECEQF